MNKFMRHMLWWLFVTVSFLPLLICALAAAVYEYGDVLARKVRRYCFQENYGKRRWPPCP